MTTKIDKTLEQVENKMLDSVGHFPILSSITGSYRAVLATVQIVVGLAAMVFGIFAACCDDWKLSKLGAKYFCHGFANLARASIEVVPLINMTLMAYDGADKPGRFSYTSS